MHAVEDALPAVLDHVGETTFDGVEFAGLPTDPEESEAVATALETNGLAAAGTHAGLDDLEEDLDAVVSACRTVDCSAVVVPWLDPSVFEERASVEAAAARLTDAAERLDDHGLSLHYHNHDQEFVDLDGRPAVETLLEAAPDVGFELDLGWAGAAGHDPLAVFEQYADRIDIAHLKDYDAETGDPVEVGRGDLDVEAVVEAVRTHDVDWLVYEVEQRPDTYETLDYADEFVQRYR
nr:sugar phosphate isomerase/epimerase [Halomarina oriensis]